MDPIFDPMAIEQWATDVGIFGMMNTKWGWPIAEIIHFYGLCLLIGTVGMFDLRMMGIARGVTMKELHRLVPVGVAGYLLCVVTGFCFIVTAPAQYLYNPAVQTKLARSLLRRSSDPVVEYWAGSKVVFEVDNPIACEADGDRTRCTRGCVRCSRWTSRRSSASSKARTGASPS